jgi:hypothetical protein
VFRSREDAGTPPVYEGKTTLTMARARRDFFSAELSLRMTAGAQRAPAIPAAALIWEALGDAERADLKRMRNALIANLSDRLVKGLGGDMQRGLWFLPPQ